MQDEQRLIEGLHADFARSCHDSLIVTSPLKIRSEISGEFSRISMAARAPGAVLASGSGAAKGALKLSDRSISNCVASFFREEVDDAVERLIGAVGVQRGQAQVTGLREGHRIFHGFAVADFADQDHVGRLAQGIFQRGVPVFGIDPDFAVGDRRNSVFVHEFHRVFDGDDVALGTLVAVTHHGGQRVDLPEPVPPTKMTSPRLVITTSFSTGGRFISSKVGILW